MTIKRNSKLTKRISAFTMAALIVMEQFAYFPQIVVSAGRSASDSGAVEFPDIHNVDEVSAILSHSDQLIDNGDGTFTFTTELKSSYSYFDESRNWMQSQDGSYTLDKAGTYLIELWGGDGGDGSSMFPLSFKAGAGGKGGFVYGLLEVSEELAAQKKKLYYEIGSRGLSETRRYDSGGTGGIGGGAGDIVIFSVGAGGGYSAVYLMDENEELTDTVRNDPSKVLMIAGGGGGGGAGAALHTLPGLFGGDGKANGGDGGTFDSDISEIPNIGKFVSADSNVGLYYAGENGSTSGTKGAYVGKGGTDIPGEIVTSFIGYLAASSYPNDWQKTYHPELDRGVGGASNFRGGGGGAGFAGGSGGMQNEPIDARNVGGGGGGSSYVGKFSNFTPRDKGDTNYFVNRDGNTNSDTGGAVVIRHLSNNGTDYNYLNSIDVSGEISQYFDVVSTNGTLSGNSFTKTGSVAPVSSGLAKGQEKDKLTISVTIKPKAGFFGGNRVPIFKENGSTFTVKGGDKTTKFTVGDDVKYVNVPYNISIKTKNSTKQTGDEISKTDIYADGYTEIAYSSSDPMQDFISGITYDILDPADNTYEASDGFAYTFADSDENNTIPFKVRATITPSGNTTAKVGDAGSNQIFSTAYIKCVDSSAIIVDGYAVTAEKSLVFNEVNGTYDLTTNLGYSSYIEKTFSVYDPISQKQQNYNTSSPSVSMQRTAAYTANGKNYNYNSPEVSPVLPYSGTKTVTSLKCSPGYYYFEVYGADGGKGGNHTEALTGWIMGYGSAGGKGAYVCGCFLISEETDVKILLGRAGYSSGSGANSRSNYYPGGGGEYSKISYLNDDSNILIAGGGGGGGGPTGNMGNKDAANPGCDAGDPGTTVTIKDKNGNNVEYEGVRSDTTYNPTNIYCGENGQWRDDYDDYMSEPNNDKHAQYVAKGGQNYRCSDIFSADDLPEYIIKPDTVNELTKDSLDAQRRSFNGTKAGAVRITKLGVKGGYKIGDSDFECTDNKTDGSTLDASLKSEILNSIDAKTEDFSLTESFSDYFNIETAEGGNINISNNSVTFTDKLSFTAGDVSATSETDVHPPIGGLPDNYKTTKRTYNFSVDDSSGTHTVSLKPKDGFLGGNDVPLLESAEISHSGNTASESDDIRAIPPLDYTDYANVALASETLEDTISSDPIFVDYGSTITADVFSGNAAVYNALDPEDWQKDHADYGVLSYEPALGTKITADTDYILTASLEADSAASKATVIDEVDTAERNFKVPVYVSYPIETKLTNLTSNAADKFPTTVDDTELVFDIYAADGYDLPAAENVEITNTDTTDPNAEPTVITDALVEKIGDKITVYIPRKSINGKVTVTASGVDAKHSVKYYYEMYDPISKMISLEEAVDSKTFANGDVISGITYPSRPDEYPNGYDGYFWDWSIEADNNGDHIMGQEDVIIIGTYKPITYAITVNYYTKESADTPDADAVLHHTYTSPLDRTKYENDTYDIALTKGAEFYIASPEIKGYVTNMPYVSGKVDDAFIAGLNETVYDVNNYAHPSKTVDVYYTKVPEGTELIVNFVECDVRGAPLNKASSKSAITHVSGYNYSLISGEIATAISGYDKVKITKFASDGTQTEVEEITGAGTYNVYYREKPQTVTIKLYKNIGDTDPIATRTAVIGREYSYVPEKDDFIPLPTTVDPTHEYRHTGWRTAVGDIIEDDTIVTGSKEETIDLYAVWESSKITITVKYLYAWNVQQASIRGTEAHAQYVHQTDYGKSYEIISPTLQNYTAEPLRVTGVALADKPETVYYTENAADITIKANIYSLYYKDSDSGKAIAGAPLLKGGTFELYAQDGTLIGTKQNTSGVVSWDNKEFDIRKGMTYTIKCTAPPDGYGTGEATVTVGTSDDAIVIDDIEIFLDVTPFEMPYAGSTPMTGYTVFGLSTMVLAVFLLFVHMRSKTEEEKIKKIRRV